MSDSLDAFLEDHQARHCQRSNPPESGVICPECGAEMVLRESKKFRWKNGKARLFYGCTRYPFCKAAHGAHPNGKPLGKPGNAETKAARVLAHAALDAMSKRLNWHRNKTYEWQCRIAKFDVWQCEKVIKLCQE
jgi:ssDNA-binding Zn-finger/Zn-ribbon topoisomerase 1